MAKVIKPERVLNGTFATLWIDDEEMAEALGLEAKVTLEKAEISQVGTLSKGYKITGVDGKGTVKLNKVSSFFIQKLSANLKQGKTTTCVIRTKLADPDSTGEEDLTLFGCTFDELTLADWESRKILEESVPFSFGDWEITSTIDHASAIS